MNQKDKPSAATETAYLDESAFQYDEKRFLTEAGKALDAVEQRLLLKTLSQLSPGSQVLDVGCGTGRFLVSACKQGFECSALDASPDMLTIAKSKVKEDFPGTNFYLADAADIPVGDSAFDLVYSIRMINQTASVEHALRIVSEMFRVVKPGGSVLVEFVNHYRPRSRTKSQSEMDVYIKPADVIRVAKLSGAKLHNVRGAFFFGMTAQHRVPSRLRPVLNLAERVMTSLLPKMCARCYIQFDKPSV